MKSILDRTFSYRNSANTDVGKTIRKEQRRLEALRVLDEANAEQARLMQDALDAKVSALPAKKRA